MPPVVGDQAQQEPHFIRVEAVATQPGNLHRLVVFFGPLLRLRFTSFVVEPHPRATVRLKVRHNETVAREQFSEVELHSHYNLSRHFPTPCLVERFINLLEPDARSRPVFAFHKPETFAEWLTRESRSPRSTLRANLKHTPPLLTDHLWPAQIRAIKGLEESLADSRPRALIQMVSDGGKIFTRCNFCCRLIKHANVKRILSLVDRTNLGKQTHKEFQNFTTPGDGRKLTELHNVQHMCSNQLETVSKVVITTIERLYSMLKGERKFDPQNEEGSQFEINPLDREPLPVIYNPEPHIRSVLTPHVWPVSFRAGSFGPAVGNCPFPTCGSGLAVTYVDLNSIQNM